MRCELIPDLKTAHKRLLDLVSKLVQENLFSLFTSQEKTSFLNGNTRLFWYLGDEVSLMLVDIHDQEISLVKDTGHGGMYAEGGVHPALVQLVIEDIERTYKDFLDQRMKGYQSYIRNRDPRKVASFEDWQP